MSGIPVPVFRILVDDQDVTDIVDGVIEKHNESKEAYDQIYSCFDGPGDWMEVCSRIFSFLKREIAYEVESEDWQYVSCPQTLMKKAKCDCKGYALFVAGVIDAMRRHGEDADWAFRFASYGLFKRLPSHVFVILFPGTEQEIWIDPVLQRLNTRWPRPVYFYDCAPSPEKKRAAAIGKINAAIGLSSAEQQLLNQLKEYSDGVGDAVNVSLKTGVLSTITLAIVQTASAIIPVVKAALAILGAVTKLVSNEFGAGSLAARILNDWSTNPITAPVTMFESIFSGRTFESDQYEAAGYYQYYVLGNTNAPKIADITDAEVFPALRWFMDRLGVFISGAQHIRAIATSPQAYINQYQVNTYTTTDINRVNAAYNVASKYFILGRPPGSWANAVGVYDVQLAEIAYTMNESIESAAAQQGYSGVYSKSATTGPAIVENNRGGFTIPLPAILLGLAGIVILSLPKK